MGTAGVGWIAAIIIGGLAGWLAEMFMKSDTGIVMNIILGIVGAVLANAILSVFGRARHPPLTAAARPVACNRAVLTISAVCRSDNPANGGFCGAFGCRPVEARACQCLPKSGVANNLPVRR